MKGIAKTVVFFIMAVILFLIFLILAFPAVQKVLAFISEKFHLAHLSPLEKAILCSYYRCVEGCSSGKTSEYCEGLYEGSWADVCSKPEMAGFHDNLKVCGWNAMQYPVELNGFSSDSEIGKQIGDVNFDCIIPGDSEKIGINTEKLVTLVGVGTFAAGTTTACLASIVTLGWTGFAPLAVCGFSAASIAYLALKGQTSYNNIFVLDASIIKWREKTSCDKSGFDVGKIEDAIEKFKVSTNKKLYIFTDRIIDKLIIDYGDRKMTTISTVQPYYIFSPSKTLSYQDILEEPENGIKKYRAVTDKGEYIFWIDINSEINSQSAPEGTTYYCIEPYWINFFVKKANGETKSAEFRNAGDKSTLFDFEIKFNEWKDKKCKIAVIAPFMSAHPPNAYGFASFTITYLTSAS